LFILFSSKYFNTFSFEIISIIAFLSFFTNESLLELDFIIGNSENKSKKLISVIWVFQVNAIVFTIKEIALTPVKLPGPETTTILSIDSYFILLSVKKSSKIDVNLELSFHKTRISFSNNVFFVSSNNNNLPFCDTAFINKFIFLLY